MKKRHLFLSLVSVSLLSLVGCAQQMTRRSASMPVSKLIEPVKDSQQISLKTPLTFPVSVAIVAVPGTKDSRQVPDTTLRLAAEKLRLQLLAHSKYVRRVAVVEHDDLRGSVSLKRIRALYAADTVIILSHQQDQRGNQKGTFGLLDATIVGLFLVPGNEVKTSSLIDGKVIHVPSNAIIFRASGRDERTYKSTTYALEGSFTEESIKGIVAATADFGDALVRTLTQFDRYDLSQAVPVSALETEESGSANDYWSKVDTYKSTGAGAFGIIPLLICAATCCAAGRRK